MKKIILSLLVVSSISAIQAAEDEKQKEAGALGSSQSEAKATADEPPSGDPKGAGSSTAASTQSGKKTGGKECCVVQ